MAAYPSKITAHLPNPAPSGPVPSSPSGYRTIRRLQSAHSLSSTAALNGPSLISLQRQQQQQQQRTKSSNNRDLTGLVAPPVPPLPAHGRSRSNSDAPAGSIFVDGSSPRRKLPVKKSTLPGKNNSEQVTLDSLIRDGPHNGDIAAALRDMRYLILTDGVLSDGDGMSSLRIYIWLILLCAPPLPTDHYLALVHRGPSPAYAKIRNDTFRTLATDPLFRRRVSEASLIRLLNAVAWTLHDSREQRLYFAREDKSNQGGSESQSRVSSYSAAKPDRAIGAITSDESEAGGAEPGTYVQGMNVLAAPFLYAARSEAEAFIAFHRFLTKECPGYVRGAMDGVHRGLALVDKVLAIVDVKLSAYLLSKGMLAEIYAFPSVLTLCACTPPLPEVLHLWDFLFAYGAHLNVLCIVAQLVMIRDAIMTSPSPTKILRSFPPLQAAKVKMIAISLVKKIPGALYDEIVIHAR